MAKSVSLIKLGVWAAFFALCGASAAWAAPQKAAAKKTESLRAPVKPGVDSAKVRKLYLDGEFEPAIEILETTLKQYPSLNHGDSVFIFKHLGVMYAAKYETREKGKFYMTQLLNVEPTARILDMYASDMIYMIFKNIQEEFEANRVKLDHAIVNLHGNGQTEPVEPLHSESRPAKQPAKESKSHVLAWVGVTTALVAAAVATYIILDKPPKDEPVAATFE